MKKDTCFNVGSNNIASYIKVDPNKLALKIKRKLKIKRGSEHYHKIKSQRALPNIHEWVTKTNLKYCLK